MSRNESRPELLVHVDADVEHLLQGFETDVLGVDVFVNVLFEPAVAERTALRLTDDLRVGNPLPSHLVRLLLVELWSTPEDLGGQRTASALRSHRGQSLALDSKQVVGSVENSAIVSTPSRRHYLLFVVLAYFTHLTLSCVSRLHNWLFRLDHLLNGSTVVALSLSLLENNETLLLGERPNH